MRQRRTTCRPARKLEPGTDLSDLVVYLLRRHFSPQQIADKPLCMKFPKLEDVYVCRQTICNAIYALPVGELRKLIICLRHETLPFKSELIKPLNKPINSGIWITRSFASICWKHCLLKLFRSRYSFNLSILKMAIYIFIIFLVFET